MNRKPLIFVAYAIPICLWFTGFALMASRQYILSILVNTVAMFSVFVASVLDDSL